MSPPGYSPLERVRDPGYTGFPADRFDIERLSEELTRYKQALERIENCPYPSGLDDVPHTPIVECHDAMRRIAREALHREGEEDE